MERLNLQLHSLPQELYDHIFDEVFAAPRSRIDIGQSYGPPQLLTISSATSKQFATSYYRNTTFVVDNDVILHQWIRRVAAAGHLDLVRDVRFINRSLLDPVSKVMGKRVIPKRSMQSVVSLSP